MELQPLPPRPSAVDACAERLEAAVLSGELPVGSRLPPERTLAQRLGVNRVTVRSALARLASAGLLRVRQGSGYVVRDFRHEAGSGLLPGLAEHARSEGRLRDVVEDLLLVRRHLARAVLERVDASRRLDEVERAVDAFEAEVRAGAAEERLAEADIAVLRSIVDLTGSVVLGLCLNPIVNVLAELPELRAAVYADAEQSVLGYRALLAGLSQSTTAAALEALEARDEATLARLEAP